MGVVEIFLEIIQGSQFSEYWEAYNCIAANRDVCPLRVVTVLLRKKKGRIIKKPQVNVVGAITNILLSENMEIVVRGP